jgi:hypothetical protein
LEWFLGKPDWAKFLNPSAIPPSFSRSVTEPFEGRGDENTQASVETSLIFTATALPFDAEL